MLTTRRGGIQKEKRRYSEKRKEKSRDAARCRRGKETEIFMELSEELPFPSNIRNQVDKASIIRLALSSIRIQHFIKRMNIIQSSLSLFDEAMDKLIMKALEGFLLILSGDGDMMYLSESVNKYLGLQQIDLVGHSIYEFSHPCDHDEIKDMLSIKAGSTTDSSLSRSFFIRMKCTLTDKGKSVNMKSAAYKVIHCTGQMMTANEKSENEKDLALIPSVGNCLVTIGEPIPHPADIQVPLDKQTFLSRHNLDMTFTYVDDRISELLGYSSDDLLGKSLYQFHHAEDGHAVEKAYKMLFSKGQCETGCYRFLAKHGGYVWVLTQATVIYGSKAQKPHCIVCINYILSGLENANEIVSDEQVENKKVADESPLISTFNNVNNNNNNDDDDTVSSAPLPCTNTIFAPRTKDMSKGFLMFVDDDSGYTVLKDEPEDLTHLAPTAGDVCIPLDVPSFSNDMFEDVLFSDSFCCDSELIGDFPSLIEEVIPCQTNLPLTNDPLLSYRADNLSSNDSDDITQTTMRRSGSLSSTDLRSSSSNSPISDHDRINDNSSPCNQLRFLGFKLETANMLSDKSSDVDLEVDEFELRAPYIPMGLGEDLPLLTPPDNLWSQTADSSPSKLKSPEQIPAELINPSEESFMAAKSSLAQLLQSSSPIKSTSERKDYFHTNVKSKNAIVRERLRETCNRSENEKSAFGQREPRVRSEFDGGGDGSVALAELPSESRLCDHTSQIGGYRHQVTCSTVGSTTRNKCIGVPQQTADNFLSNPADVCGSNLSKSPPTAQKRNRDFTESNGNNNISKRAKLDVCTTVKTSEENEGNKYNFQQVSKEQTLKDSVLMNLLVSGQDLSHGYSCYNTKDVSKKDRSRIEDKLHSKLMKSINMCESEYTASLLNPDGSTIPSLLDITQWDTEVNAPIYASQHLLQGQDLLNALDTTVGADETLILNTDI